MIPEDDQVHVVADSADLIDFRQFSVHGLLEAEHEFNVLCLAYNLKKLHKFLKGRPFGAFNGLENNRISPG